MYLSEAEILLEDLIGIEDDTKQRAEEDYKTKKISEDEDRAKALEMRKRPMERVGETRATSYPGSFFGEGKTLVGAGHVTLTKLIA